VGGDERDKVETGWEALGVEKSSGRENLLSRSLEARETSP